MLRRCDGQVLFRTAERYNENESFARRAALANAMSYLDLAFRRSTQWRASLGEWRGAQLFTRGSYASRRAGRRKMLCTKPLLGRSLYGHRMTTGVRVWQSRGRGVGRRRDLA